MKLDRTNIELEELNVRLNEDAFRDEYQHPCDDCKISLLPRILGNFLIGCGNLFYGRNPSYLKFRAIEVIARVPYHSWTSATYTLLTLFYMNETKALALSDTARYANLAQENETMHVVVITQFAKQERKAGFLMHTLIPIVFAFFYFWATYWLYFISPRWSYELNYLFEDHAFSQYDAFLKANEKELQKKPAESDFLKWYGRHPQNQYEFFRSVRNDELIHRNSAFQALLPHTH